MKQTNNKMQNKKVDKFTQDSEDNKVTEISLFFIKTDCGMWCDAKNN